MGGGGEGRGLMAFFKGIRCSCWPNTWFTIDAVF